MQNKVIVILGPTASGKTQLATQLAAKVNGAVISADSRQVYRGMDIGTGKDLDEYIVDGKHIPHYLIDICDAGEKYSVHEFQDDFKQAAKDTQHKGMTPILCGGTGLYIESVINNFEFTLIPFDNELREELDKKPVDDLLDEYKSRKPLEFNVALESKRRLIRAIEMQRFLEHNEAPSSDSNSLDFIVFGIDIPRELRREKITNRLKARLEEGLIEEAQLLIKNGVSLDDLRYYGLEYKFLAEYLDQNIDKKELFTQLNIAIHQFAKRQMTFFRHMEKRGININWIDYFLPTEDKIKLIAQNLS